MFGLEYEVEYKKCQPTLDPTTQFVGPKYKLAKPKRAGDEKVVKRDLLSAGFFFEGLVPVCIAKDFYLPMDRPPTGIFFLFS